MAGRGRAGRGGAGRGGAGRGGPLPPSILLLLLCRKNVCVLRPGCACTQGMNALQFCGMPRATCGCATSTVLGRKGEGRREGGGPQPVSGWPPLPVCTPPGPQVDAYNQALVGAGVAGDSGPFGLLDLFELTRGGRAQGQRGAGFQPPACWAGPFPPDAPVLSVALEGKALLPRLCEC